MELGTIIGLAAGIVFMFLSMFMGADYNLSGMMVFVDGASVMITVGGTTAATLIAVPLPRVVEAFKAARFVFVPPRIDPSAVVEQIIQMSALARKEGLLTLEEPAKEFGDPFLLKGIMLIADGGDADLVRNVMETEISYLESRHSSARGVFEFIGASAPAWGMVGTLIGLILMLNNLRDVAGIGPAMGVAIITTFYGSIIANLLAIPIANKLKVYSDEELLVKELQVEGMLSILNGENPRNIEEKLKAFVSPSARFGVGSGNNAIFAD